MITIFKTKEHKPIIFKHEDYKKEVFFNLNHVYKNTISRYKTLSELSSSIDSIGTNFIIRCRDVEFHIYPGIILCKSFSTIKPKGIVIICEGKFLDKYALLYDGGLTTTERTIINKFIKRYEIKRSDVRSIPYEEYKKKIEWPIELSILDWNKEEQNKMSGLFIKNLKENNNE